MENMAAGQHHLLLDSEFLQADRTGVLAQAKRSGFNSFPFKRTKGFMGFFKYSQSLSQSQPFDILLPLLLNVNKHFFIHFLQ
jgi:hypothetical protein